MESEDLIQPTLLVLGYSSTNSIGESVFVRGGDALREALPDISATSLRDKVSSITLSPIGSRFFLGSLVVKNDEKKKDSSNDYDSDDDCIPIFIRWGSRSRPSISSVGKSDSCTTFDGPLFTLDSFDLSSASLAMSVFYKGKDKKAFKAMEKSLSDRRKISVANAWFKLSLTQRKRRLACDDVVTFLGSDEDLQKDLVEDKDKDKGKKKKKERSRYPPMFGGMRNKTKDSEKSKEHQGPYKGQALLARLAELINPSISVTLDQGVAIVLGLSSPGRTPADAPEVPLSAFSKAFQTLIRNQKSRAELWKEPDSEDQKDKEDEKNEDPVVKSVKDASDLTSYESTLLSCIVDPSTLNMFISSYCVFSDWSL
ncbi:hypothetical protein BDQ17DRAFT_202734 [Cyathus striatus]|nr:hypothetical protein BDQ17DRAFT_202734 [Cyathus striatus]